MDSAWTSHPKPRRLTRQAIWRLGWMSLYSGLLGGVLYTAFSHWGYDDPFITYRYADNLARGLGFVYNPGERVLSTTTPFFTLLLAGLSHLWPDIPRLANLIGALSIPVGGLFIWDLAQSWETPAAGWAGLLLYPLFPLLLMTQSSETPLYLACCLGAYACYARRKYTWTATLAALAVLTRPDGVLVPVLLAAGFTLGPAGFSGASGIPPRVSGWRQRLSAIPWPAVLVFLSLTLAWFIFAWSYFGTPIPATLAAKQHQGAMAISERFGPGFSTILRWYSARHYQFMAGLAILGLVYALARRRAWLLILAWPALYFTAYSILGVSRYFWYYAPLVPGFIVGVGLGISALAGLLGMVAGKRSARLSYLPSILAGCLLAGLIFTLRGSLLRLPQQPDNRLAIYQAVGNWLAANTAPGSSVGTLEVGIIGYYARRPMIDFAGLIQPQIAAQLGARTGFEDSALWAASYYQPDYLVLLENAFPGLERRYVEGRCRLSETFTGAGYGYPGNLRVYACQEHAQ